MTAWIVRGDVSPGTAVVGGKGDGLFRLRALGLDVPSFVVLAADAYRDCCKDGVPQVLPSIAEAALDEAWAAVASPGAALAVRSSAVDEDGAERSFAGQMETVLGVRDRAALSAAVLRCWRSLHGDRAVAYRAASGAATARLAMAVVIQRLVEPDVSGVLFTVDPAAGRADQALVSAVWGLGEGLVSGALDADTFVVGRDGAVRERRLAEKTERIIAGPGGTEHAPVQEERRRAPTLDDAALAALVRSALAAETAAGHALDIEFCVEGGRTWFLQARPVTAFVERARPELGNRQVWDNSNIVESYGGVTMPLTWSFIRSAYRAVYWQFCELLGLREDEIRARDDVLSNMLGWFRGRVYYNLLNWYRLCSLLPGFRFNKSFMEGMMGLRTPEALPEPPLTAREKWLVEMPRLVRSGFRAVRLQWTLERRIAEFHRDFEAVHARHAALDFAALPPRELMLRYAELERDVLWRWKAPIVNDFSAMIFFGMLRKLTAAWDVDREGGLANALVSRDGRIESTQVSDSLLAVARGIAADASFAAAFVSAAPETALERLREHAVHGAAFRTHIDRFGDRCAAELKLESVPPRDEPRPTVELLQARVRRGVPPAAAPDAALREDALDIARRRLGWRTACLVVPRRWIYAWVADRARAAIRNRENQRLARTRAFGLVRRIFRSIGASFARDGTLEHAEDVFLLEVEEIRRHVEGAPAQAGARRPLREIAAARRADVARWRRHPPLPDHFVTWGPVHPDAPIDEETPPAAPDALTGLGACPGVVEAEAIVLTEPDPSAPVEGKVLVTYQTDPGWVVLFPSLRGLVVERGSLLSHSAIVAREMGIPAVVGVRGVVAAIRTGDRLRIDGARGTVEVAGRADGAASVAAQAAVASGQGPCAP